MTTEAEARQTLIEVAYDLLAETLYELGVNSPDHDDYRGRPLTGVEIDDLTKKLFRVSQTLKTAQSLSTV